jgi:hypothetical protein
VFFAFSSGPRAAVTAFKLDVQRRSVSVHDLFRDHYLLDAFEASKHGVERNAFHDGAQAVRTGLALDRLLGR